MNAPSKSQTHSPTCTTPHLSLSTAAVVCRVTTPLAGRTTLPGGGHLSPPPFAVHPRRIPCVSARSHELALAIGRRLIRVLRLFNLANQQLKGARHVLAVSRAGLGPCALVALGELLALLGRDLALLGAEVGFVADDADGDGVCALFLGGGGLVSVWGFGEGRGDVQGG